MAHTRRSSVSFSSFLLLISFVASQRTPISKDPSYYYNLCAPSTCGNLSLTYPFASQTPCHPSSLEVTCINNTYLLVHHSLYADPPKRVLSIDYTDPNTISFFVAYNGLFTCGTHLSYQTFRNHNPAFSLTLNYTIGMHYNCTTPISPNSIQGLQNASCIGCKGQDPSNFCYYSSQFVTTAPPNCQIFATFTPGGPSSFNASAVKDLRGLLQKGFELKYNTLKDCRGCEASGGRCGAKPTSGSFVCYCPFSVHSNNCTDEMTVDISTWVNTVEGKGSVPSTRVIATLSASASTLLLILIVAIMVIFTRRRNKNIRFNKETISGVSPTRYTYSQLKKFTNNFSSKLGEGGFASVYKGTIYRKIGDEVTVAVKVMKKTAQIEKQFMNEIGTVGSVHHHNLVSMLGYCVDRGTHALVYEFVENGSLDNYIYTRKEGSDNKRLSTKQVYVIALETARGILYLHQGCRVKILHCDIKPSNVLVDATFSAKVADFGLARMIDKDHSHLSLREAQGTPGYAAPEMWLKSFGPVTEKSDVYSYGMLLLEMVGRRKIYDSEVDDSNEAYLPEFLCNKMKRDEFASLINQGSGRKFSEIPGDEESNWVEDVTKMCLVGLWCIQNIPSNRPFMDRVVQMLEGHVEIGTPPNPFPQNSTKSSSSQEPLILQEFS